MTSHRLNLLNTVPIYRNTSIILHQFLSLILIVALLTPTLSLGGTFRNMSQDHPGDDSALLELRTLSAFSNSPNRITPPLAASVPCSLYPIALSSKSLTGIATGGLIGDIYNGTQPGNFGWLTWSGDPSEPTLVASLTPPGNSGSYVNPNSASDHEVSVGDWVRGKPGISNSNKVRDALDALKARDIMVPVWNETRGQGSNSLYRVAAFAKVRLLSYQLPSQNRISARFLGYSECPTPVNQTPQVNAGPDQTVTLPGSANLNGVVTDDGLPRDGTLTILWTKVSGPGSVTLSNASRPTTNAAFSMAGVYVLRLTASDSQLSSSDDVIVTVNPGNQMPTVYAGADQTITLPNLAQLNGSATDDGLPAGGSLTTSWSQVSGPGGVTFANPTSATTTASFDAPGTYVLRLSASDSALTSSDELTVTVEAKPFSSRVYTLNADFDEGSTINVVHNVPDQLQLDDTTRAFNFIWVAISSKGTIVKINTETGAVLGEYHTAPEGQATDPSRTTVDHNGSVWATNRAGNSVVRVGLLENGQCVDRNGNGVIETSQALGDVRAWPNADGRDSDGGVETAADECIINYVRVSSSGTRHVSVNAENDVWVSGTGGQIFDLIDGETGLIKRTERSVGYGGYGGLIDKSGVIWSARRLLRWDTSKPLSGVNGDNWLGYEHDSYGLCIDSKGNVWNTQLENSAVRKFAPDGTLVGIFPHGNFYAQGCVIGNNDDVWVAHSIAGPQSTVGHLKNDGMFIGNVPVGSGPTGVAVDASGKIWATNYYSRTVSRINPAAGPMGADGVTPIGEVDFTTVDLGGNLYNYSDMTGSTLSGAPREGTWTTIFDSGVAGAEWGQIGWTARVCGDGSLTVAVASSEDGTSFGPSEIVTSGADPSVANGRYLKISVSFRRAASGESPVLYDLSVGTQGFALPPTLNAPPEINAGPDQTISLPSTAILNGSVCDDALPGNGLSISWTKLSGPGIVTFSKPDQVKTEAAFTAPGTYVLRLTAGDSEKTASDDVTITVTPPNQAPVPNAGPDQTISLPEAANLDGAVTDDGLPIGSTISSLWTKVSGPGNVTFANPNVTVTSASFSVAGTYVLRLTASDSQLTGSDELTVTVHPPNQPPVVNAGSDQTISLPTDTTALSGTVNDDGLPSGGALTITWSKVSGPGSVILGSAGQLVTTAKFSATGTYVLRLTASDSQLTGSDDVTVTVTEPNQPPVVNAGPDQIITLPQTSTLNGAVTDDGLPVDNSLTTTWSAISGPGAVTFANMNAGVTTASFSMAGVYVLRLSASDSDLSSSDDVSITVNPQPIPPTVAIHSLSDGIDVTSPIDITGDVSGGQWVLEYSINSNSGSAAQNWVTFASGNNPVSNGTLGRFDPTVLLNGTYTVRLTAVDIAGQISSVSTSIIVNGDQKVGNFSISFNDLSIPVAGLPLQVIRTYDSRDKRVGDFGVGWTLDIRNVRVEKTGLIGRGWQQTRSSGFFPNYCLQSTKPRLVTITFQDGKVYKFRAVSNPQCQLLLPIQFATVGFTPVEGTHGALSALGSTDVFYDGSSPGVGDLLDPDDFNPYDPTMFSLTTEDGTVYVIDQHAGVRSMTDTNGNTLTINHDGIIHSSGKSVTFTRDSQGRITQITDPAGNSMSYTYDANGDLVTFSDRENNVSRYTYNSTHGLLTILDPRGIQPLRNDYDADGRLIKQTDAFGNVITFTHDLDARREIVRDRLGNPTVYEYDTNGNVLRVTDAKGGVTTRTYDGRDNPLSETNAEGKVTSYTYDPQDNRLSETDPLGNTTRFTYNARRQLLTVTDALGHVTNCTYDQNGNLTSLRDVSGNTTTATYDPMGNKTSMTDPLGNTTSFQYNASGNLIKQTDPSGNVTNFTYDANGNRLSETVTRSGDQPSITTTYQYDRLNRLVRTTLPNGTATESVLDSAGRRTSYTDELGHQTNFGYDDGGQLTRTTYADGLKEEFTYDAHGRRTKIVDRAGRAINYTYDPLGRIVKTTFADGTFTALAYNAIGQVSSSTDALGRATGFEYNAAGQQTKVTDRLGNVTTLTYDGNGNRTSMLDARGQLVRYEYDAANRQTKIIYPDGTSQLTAYNTAGQMISKTDQAGRTTRFEYEQRGKLAKVIDALGGTTTYTYDELGNQLTQADANNHTTRYEYDQMGRRTRRTLPLGMSETYVYDGAGLLTSRTDFRSKTTSYAYDVMNRLLSKTPDASLAEPSVTFTYTATGQRATMADASGLTTYNYDVQDRLTSKQTPQGTLAYTYDSAGNVLTVRSSNSEGLSSDYSYDALGRLASVRDNRSASGLTTYTYDANGNLASTLLPNGVQTGYTYDALNRLTHLGTAKAGTTLSSYSYSLAATGHRLSVTDQTGRNVNYTYDALNRLTSEVVAGDPATNGSIGYTYDAVGNRLSRTSVVPGVAPSTAIYDANDRLSSDTYDANGNTLLSNGTDYTYDFENHLTRATEGAVTCVYDGDGNRVAKTVGGVTTRYLVDTDNHTGHPQVADELRGGQVVRQYTYGHDLISQRQQMGSQWQTSYYGYDGQGSVRYLTDGAGAVTDTYTYDAFGTLISRSGTTPNDYLFGGEQFDPDLNLYYLRARYFNQGTGRFVSADTFEGFNEDPQSLHKYTYAHNDPVNFADPSGNFEFSIAGLTMNISISSILSGIAVGVLRGAGVGAIIGAADAALGGDDIVEGFVNGLMMGALLGPFARVKVVLPLLQLFGLYTGITSAADSFSEGNSAQGVFRAGLAVFTGLAFFRTISGILRAPQQVRAPQDIGRESNYPNPPPPNDGASTIGSNANRSASLARDLRIARFLRATDIRVNQEQVNAQGVRVGRNRPDLQFTLFGRLRIYVEYDPTNPVGNRGPGHRSRIFSNDSGGCVILKTLD